MDCMGKLNALTIQGDDECQNLSPIDLGNVQR
jgi:hypothetical protein